METKISTLSFLLAKAEERYEKTASLSRGYRLATRKRIARVPLRGAQGLARAFGPERKVRLTLDNKFVELV